MDFVRCQKAPDGGNVSTDHSAFSYFWTLIDTKARAEMHKLVTPVMVKVWEPSD